MLYQMSVNLDHLEQCQNISNFQDSMIAILELPSGEFDVCTDLNTEQLKRLSQLVKENEDLFAVDPKLPSRTSMCEHAIETGDAAPIKERARRGTA